jgi:uncharacterized DUF497 family protein
MFGWDPDKHAANLRAHGVRFEVAALVFDGPVLEWPDEREDYGEDRWIAVGMADNWVLVVVYTERGSLTWIISARKATTNETKAYEDFLTGRR